MKKYIYNFIKSKGRNPCLLAYDFMEDCDSLDEAWKTNKIVGWALWYLMNFRKFGYQQAFVMFYRSFPEKYRLKYTSDNPGYHIAYLDYLKELHPSVPEHSIYSPQELADIFIASARRYDYLNKEK